MVLHASRQGRGLPRQPRRPRARQRVRNHLDPLQRRGRPPGHRLQPPQGDQGQGLPGGDSHRHLLVRETLTGASSCSSQPQERPDRRQAARRHTPRRARGRAHEQKSSS